MQETADHCSQPGSSGTLPFAAKLALVVCGPDGPRAVPLSRDGELVVGRHSSCQLSLSHPSLSRYHARFVRRGSTVTVEDLGSRHGTWVAGKRVERAELSVGASVRLANIVVALTEDRSAVQTVRSVSPAGLLPDALYVSPRMRELRALLHKLAQTDLPVLVLGETGTGKELAARELHLASPRKDGPLRVLNCAAIPPNLIESTLFGHERGAFTGADRARAGVFEEARAGTVFLDEVGELSSTAQAALLRVLETRRVTRVGSTREIEVDVRIVSATHRDLHAMTARGEFRVDILHRLSIVPVELPALRCRREEIPALARHFLAKEGIFRTLDPQALARLEHYDWPGNVRELRNVVMRAAVLAEGPCITEADLPQQVRAAGQVAPLRAPPPVLLRGASSASSHETLRTRLQRVEHAELLNALEETAGNQRRAAALLGLPLRTFERRLRALRGA